MYLYILIYTYIARIILLNYLLIKLSLKSCSYYKVVRFALFVSVLWKTLKSTLYMHRFGFTACFLFFSINDKTTKASISKRP